MCTRYDSSCGTRTMIAGCRAWLAGLAVGRRLRPGLWIARSLFLAALCPAQAWALLPPAETGNLYVSMWSADEIAVFSPTGMPIERFTSEGLDGPRGIAFNPGNGDIWVAGEFSNAIFIFDRHHQFVRRLDHADFDEPVGITFSATAAGNNDDQLVYISNSNGNEIMVFDVAGTLLRRFTDATLNDPNCSAVMADGTLLIANRLGGSMGGNGAVASFDRNEIFQFDFSTRGISSLMAVARDPGSEMNPALNETVWVTSGGGDTGIYEFDLSGNLLKTLLPADIDDGRPIVPQGIVFDDAGDFYVVSYLNEVIKFDSDGNFLLRFPTGGGTARSTALQRGSIESPAAQETSNNGGADAGETPVAADNGGGNAFWLTLILTLSALRIIRR